jgi:alpha-L-rhamnosidase
MSDGTAVRPVDLHCEHRRAPVGIDEPRPLLAWRLHDPTERHGAAPTAARVVVHELLAGPDSAQLAASWDSGWLTGTSTAVEYAGRALRSGTSYRWTVTVRDDLGGEVTSEPSTWTTGILHADEWQSAWITRDPRARPIREAPTGLTKPATCWRLSAPLQVRRRFRLDAVPIGGLVHVTARGLFRLYVNGARVGTDELTPGWADYHYRPAHHRFPRRRAAVSGVG